MKCLLMCGLVILGGCSSGSVDHAVVEDISNIDVGGSASYCNQLRMECTSQAGQIAGANGHYTEWENADGSIGCSCDKQ
ncbi:hypothetical protein [Alteromonas halophila]|uniref:Lipoprotein n=1 Tax=Alteromonas halophila TaxID=516698 RepID=A0A918JEE6_9ALTE|nr:hypothetical protein [Alteromonas halophila]GGW73720.1 hypothetical protein GCM10007391_01760 [Alteromonas halophila]